MRLTKLVVEKAKYGGSKNSRCMVMDDEVPGFGLRVFPSGRKVFVLRYRTTVGRERMQSIGDFPTLTVQEARARAVRIRADVLDGGDPLDEKQNRRRGATVAQLAEAYLERYAKVHKITWEKDQRQLRAHVLPAWGRRKVDSIQYVDVDELHRRIGRNTPIEANRTIALVRKMFNFARTTGFLEQPRGNPATGIEMFPETKRDRWITPEELPRLAKAIDAEESPFIRAAMWLLVLTGLRRTELLEARWSNVDFARRELRIPTTKSGRPHIVPLSGQAMAILNGLPRLEGNHFILPGRDEGKPINNIDKPWGRIRKAAGIEDARLHDLRRTVGSWLAMDGASLLVIGKTLNQSSPATTAVYARLNFDPVREALERHGAKVEAVIRGGGAEVSTLPSAKGAKR